jgi:hypothetical protein
MRSIQFLQSQLFSETLAIRKAATLTALVLLFGLGLAANAQDSAFQPGDVFVSLETAQVKEFTPAGVLVQTLDSPSQSAGMAFDLNGNLYVTDLGGVSEFNNNGVLINPSFITGQALPVSISMPGGYFPALVGDEDLFVINKYNNLGQLIDSYNVETNGLVGPSFVDMLPDRQNVLYTLAEGDTIYSYNLVTRSQNPPFAAGLPFETYALKKLLTGPFAGDVLVGGIGNASGPWLVAPGGGIVKDYDLLGQALFPLYFCMTLSADSTSFWTCESDSGQVWQVDIATGSILQQWGVGVNLGIGGIAIFPATGQGATPCARCGVQFDTAKRGEN